MTLIYKITPKEEWRRARDEGVFAGAPVDLADGFIHFSTRDQAAETASRHFAGMDDLLLVAVDASKLGERLRWEPSRGGDLFPHLYGPLSMDAVVWARPMPLEGGVHRLPFDT